MARRAALTPLTLAALLAVNGWLYVLRLPRLPGPRLREALPLDELARHDATSLLWYAVLWLTAGTLLGAAARWAGVERTTAALVLALVTLGFVYVTTTASIAVSLQISVVAAMHVAQRLGAVYVPAAAVALPVALIARPERNRRYAPAVVATLVAIAALLELAYRVFPDGGRHSLMRDLVPHALGQSVRAAGAFAGLVLLAATRGLFRRRRRAWEIAVAVTVFLVVLHVLHGVGPGTLVTALTLVVLLARRHDFTLPGDSATRYLIFRRVAIAVTTIAVYAAAALWINRLDADSPFTLAFAFHETVRGLLGLSLRGSAHLTGAFGDWFPKSLFLLGLGAAYWSIFGWLAPWRHHVRQESPDRERAAQLVREWGADTLAPFALRRDKSYFFADDRAAVLAYRVVGGVAIVSGDPIGRPEAIPDLLRDFAAHARVADWRLAILGASSRWLGLYRSLGLHVLYHGDEAVVDTEQFSLEGRAIRKVRQSVTRLQVAGYSARVLRPSELTVSMVKRFEDIAGDWRAGQPERGFAMALDTLLSLGDDDAVFVVGFDPEGIPQGYLHYAIVHAGKALSLSSMPRVRASTPNGFNEWLICEAIAWAREHGFARVSLNFAPFAAVLAPEAELKAAQRVQRGVLLSLKGHFQLDRLLTFNRKFFPRWEQRFLVYERRRDLPRVGIAALAAEAYLPFQTARR